MMLLILIITLLDYVRFFEESEYNLHSLKEITVTDSFMGLKSDKRKCQSIETYHDCLTRKYIENMMKDCGCLPLSHILSDKVRTTNNNKVKY